ncbi:hypothetical protein V8G54_012450 [Vigna mungo]|uniref:Uncharacterized protein n=1 Tax=Vigna mungo TaxID=3915 RepID=A0AAQ3S412_VIGMU
MWHSRFSLFSWPHLRFPLLSIPSPSPPLPAYLSSLRRCTSSPSSSPNPNEVITTIQKSASNARRNIIKVSMNKNSTFLLKYFLDLTLPCRRKSGEMGRNALMERAEAHGLATMLVYGKGETLGLEDSEGLGFGKRGLGFGKQRTIMDFKTEKKESETNNVNNPENAHQTLDSSSQVSIDT